MELAKPILAEEHRKFSTKNNEFNLPDEVLDEIGLKEP
jgi:hypothetical protein